MKILLLNGSPRRNGNTAHATQKIVQSLQLNTTNTIEAINILDFTVGGCIACDGCQHNGGHCVIEDDTQFIIDKALGADVIIFASPVYWWGVSSQLKAVIDKFYSNTATFSTQKKKIGVVTIGAAETSDKQYTLINDQFSCICDFLGWEKIFNLSFSASDVDDLQKSDDANLQLDNIYTFIS